MKSTICKMYFYQKDFAEFYFDTTQVEAGARPDRTVILSQRARWRENPPDVRSAICRALLPEASISGILTPVTSVYFSK